MPSVTLDLTPAQVDALCEQLGLERIKVLYADVLFDGAYRSWRYKVPSDFTVKIGSRVTVDNGLYAGGEIGTVTDLTTVPPPSHYVYNIADVA